MSMYNIYLYTYSRAASPHWLKIRNLELRCDVELNVAEQIVFSGESEMLRSRGSNSLLSSESDKVCHVAFYLPTKLVAFLLNCSKTKMIILLFSRGVKFTTSLCRGKKKVVSNCCFGGVKVSHKQTRVRQAKLCRQQPHSVFMNLYTQTYLCRTLRTSVVGSTSVQLGFFFFWEGAREREVNK